LCLEAKNRSEEAVAAYKLAIELDSASATHTEQPYLNLGKLFNTLDRAPEAVAPLSQAIKFLPKSATAHYELGRAQFALGRMEEAESELEVAARLDPANSSPHYLLGKIYRRLGKSQQATEQFKLTEELIRQHEKESAGMAPGR
jgi:protein O-mannosyl-transferase